MPCSSEHMEPTFRERESAKIRALLFEVGIRQDSGGMYGNTDTLNRDASELCEFCADSADISKHSLELQIWWRDHQQADKERLEREQAKNKTEQEKQEALSKLTDYEKGLLGF